MWKLGACDWSVVALIMLMSGINLKAQEFKNSIASTDFDFITSDDPSAFQGLVFQRQGKAEMPDKRGDRELFQPAFEFFASFSDGTRVQIFVDAREKDQQAAKEEAMRYVHPLGKLPTALRRGVNRLCVHDGGKTTTAFSDDQSGLIVVYADNATVRISNHDLEETIFHESVHAAWDAKHARSEAWKRAQGRDAVFVTVYAREKSEREDLAETALFAYTMIHHPDRLPEELRERLRRDIFHRIDFIEQLIPRNKPIHFPVERDSQQATEDRS